MGGRYVIDDVVDCQSSLKSPPTERLSHLVAGGFSGAGTVAWDRAERCKRRGSGAAADLAAHGVQLIDAADVHTQSHASPAGFVLVTAMGTLSATDLDTLHRRDIGDPADGGVCTLLSATVARAVCCWRFLVTVTLVEGASAHRLLAARFGSRGRAVRCASMAVGCSGESISAVDPPTPSPEMAQDASETDQRASAREDCGAAGSELGGTRKAFWLALVVDGVSVACKTMAGGERGGGRAEYPVVRDGTSLATCGGGSVRWMGQISSWLGVADSTLDDKDVLARLAKRGIRVGRSASEAGGEGLAKVDTTAVAWYCFVAVRRSRPESAACLTVSSGFDPLSTAGGIGRPTVAATVDSSIAACSCRNADTYCHNYDCAINAGMPW